MPGRNLLGNCNSCCTCSSPYIASVTRSASKSKSACAFFNTGDGQYYFTQTETYNHSSNYSGPPSPPVSCNESTTYTEIRNNIVDFSGNCSGITCIANGNSNSFIDEGPGISPKSVTINSSMTSCGNWVGTETSVLIDGSVVVLPWNSPGVSCGHNEITSDIFTYSNPYLSTQLQSQVIAFLPNWRNFSTGNASCITLASSELTASGASYSIEQGQYQFLFPVPPTFVYQIKWSVVFVPDSGIPNILSTQQFNWNGPPDNDYNVNDQSTWPMTPIYMVNQPDSNGIIKLSGISYFCSPILSGLVC